MNKKSKQKVLRTTNSLLIVWFGIKDGEGKGLYIIDLLENIEPEDLSGFWDMNSIPSWSRSIFDEMGFPI